MIFIETSIFTKYIHDYLNDAEYSDFQWYLMQNPETGDLIPGSGGLRKVRWRAKGRGKRGGTRIIYYHKNEQGEIWLLTIYSKNEVENLTKEELKLLKKELTK